MGHKLMNGRSLTHFTLQEFLPGRRIVKKVPDNKRGSVRRTDLLQAFLHTTLDTAAASQIIFLRLRNQFHHGNGGNAGQRLTTESKRRNP